MTTSAFSIWFTGLPASGKTTLAYLLEQDLAKRDIRAQLLDSDEMRTVRDNDLRRLDPGMKRIMNPHVYHVSLTSKLWNLKQD